MTWGVPDWRDADAYPAPDDLTDREWWWEFTRRRPDYRDAWKKWSALGTESNGNVSYALTDDPDTTRLKFGLSIIYDPRSSLPDWQLRQFRFPVAGCAVSVPGDSIFRHGAWLAENEPEDVNAEIMRLEARARDDEEFGLVDFRFSLSDPLQPQIEKAQKYLERRQRETFGKRVIRRARRDNWPIYLRALDAIDSDAKSAEIQEAFWPGQEKTPGSVRDTHNAARHMRDNFPV